MAMVVVHKKFFFVIFFFLRVFFCLGFFFILFRDWRFLFLALLSLWGDLVGGLDGCGGVVNSFSAGLGLSGVMGSVVVCWGKDDGLEKVSNGPSSSTIFAISTYIK